MKLEEWLSDYLTPTRQLLRDNGQPLYRYAMTLDEYQTLQATLENISILDIVNNISQISSWNAAFVVYAAEWWRCEYDGYSWSWTDISHLFGTNVRDLSELQRNQLIKKGLQYWGCDADIINDAACYLDTIAMQGGLPLRILADIES